MEASFPASGATTRPSFAVDEWVLCYEPDPSKIKVIYNAKILDIENDEYLVHFRGWNSSWDRRVTKEFLLKDNATNRVLQTSLSENIGKKGSRKKNLTSRKLVLKTPLHTNGNSNLQSPRKKQKRDDPIIKISEPCKAILKLDMSRVNKKGLFPILPSVHPVAKVLEQYVYYYAERQVAHRERSLAKQNIFIAGQRDSIMVSEVESIQNSLKLCKEMVEGLRIILDFNLNTILLYEKEIKLFKPLIDSSNLPSSHQSLSSLNSSRRPSTDRSSSSGRSTPTNSVGSSHPSCSSSSRKYISKCVNESLEGWKLLPDALYRESPPLPSLIYGPIYLLRLLVKLPEILRRMNLPLPKLRILQKHISSLMDFLTSHPEYFSECMYSSPSSDSS